MKYLKYFKKDADYYHFIEGNFLKPNVSFVEENKHVGYYPYIKPLNSFTTTTNVTNTSSYYKLFNNDNLSINNIKLMKVDDIEVSPVSSMKFSSTGEHTCYVAVNEPVTDMYKMFSGCTSLTSINLSNWDNSRVNSMFSMFENCSELTTIEGISDINTESVENLRSVFFGCKKLNNINNDTLKKWNVSKVNNMAYTFCYCEKLTSLDLSGWDTSNVTTMSGFCQSCINLTSLDLSGWDTSNLNSTALKQFLYGCTNLVSLNLSGWKINKGNMNLDYMFYNCNKLTNLILDDAVIYPKNNWYLDFCTSLSVESLVSILNALPNINNGSQECRLGATNLNKLTNEQKSIAINKGWILS